jgi:hypothetical protein
MMAGAVATLSQGMSKMNGLNRASFCGSAPLLVLAATFVIGGAEIVRCWGDESGRPRASNERSGMVLTSEPAVETEKGDSSETNRAQQITFDDLNLNLKKEKPYDASLLTEKVKQLDGKTVRIRGFLYPSFKEHGITQFVLSRDHDFELLDKCVVVDLTPPTAISFVVHAIDVEGVFSLREFKMEDGTVIAIYHLEGKKVQLVPGVLAPPSKNGC